MKVGIVTLYHQNFNYGGQLQAYALAETIIRLGYAAEQIKLINPPKRVQVQKVKKCSVNDLLYKVEKKVVQKLFLKAKFDLRRKAFETFSKTIPHSAGIYTSENIMEANNHYDAFVAGSDQIWNPVFTEKRRLRNNLLDFVGEDKISISYAASIGGFKISEENESDFRELLPKLDGISVREETAKVCLSGMVPGKEIIVCADPVLLLTAEDWMKMSVKPEIKWKYVFCYFLSDNQAMRKRAREIAEKSNLKIVTMPHMMTNYKRSDRSFGNMQSYEADPRQFVGLIANANFVITDSFHATVFSSIFRKQFLVFRRGFDKNGTSMDSRLLDYTSHFGLESRFVAPVLNEVVGVMEENIDYGIFERISANDRSEGISYLREKLNKKVVENKQ